MNAFAIQTSKFGPTWNFGTDGNLTVPGLISYGANGGTLGAPQTGGATDRIRFWDFNNTNPSGYNYAIGAEGSHLWFGMDVNSDDGGHKFYSQEDMVFKVGGAGTLFVSNNIVKIPNIGFRANITNINTATGTVTVDRAVTLNDGDLITIKNVANPSQINNSWYAKVTGENTFELYTDAELTILADTTGWEPYSNETWNGVVAGPSINDGMKLTVGSDTLTLTTATNNTVPALVVGVENTTTDLIVGSLYQGLNIAADGSVVLGARFDSGAPTVLFGSSVSSEGQDGGDILIFGGYSEVGQNGSIQIQGQYADIATLDGTRIGSPVNGWNFDNSDYALVFPDETRQYTAWQGAAIVSDTAPEDDLGRLWFNSIDGRMYVKYNDNWVDASPQVVPSPETYLEGLIVEDTTIAKTTFNDGKSISIDNEGKTVELKTTGELEVPGDLTPKATSTQKLGTATKRWKEAHIDEIHTVIDGGGASTWLTAD
jgi:hypothetical protein